MIIVSALWIASGQQMVFAYIDFGTGSFLFQVGLATFMLFVYAIRLFLKNIVHSVFSVITRLISRK